MAGLLASRCRQVGLGLGAALLLGACAGEPEPLRVGLVVWPPYEVLHVAESRGYFGQGEIEVVDYSTPAAAMRAYENEVVDAVALTTAFLVALTAVDPEQRVILAIDYSVGGDALVARPGIHSLEELEGRRVGMEMSSLGGFMLKRALDQVQLELDAVEVVHFDMSDHGDAFERFQVDAVITYEPTVARLVESGGQILFDSSQIPGEVVDVLITRSEVVAQRSAPLQRLVDGFFRARADFVHDPQSFAELAALREASTPREYLAAMDLAHLPDAEENSRLLGGGTPELLGHLEMMLEFFVERDPSVPRVDLSSVPEPMFVEATPEPTPVGKPGP